MHGSPEASITANQDGWGGAGFWGPIRRLPLGVMLRDEVAQLLDDGLDEFLPVPVCLPELGEDVVLPARLLHPADGEEEETGGGKQEVKE